MNPFQSDYSYRLREWKNLRLIIRGTSLESACVQVDKWWQQAPLVNYHLHPADSAAWPDPWTILSENIYCPLTRAVGICYTLLMSDITEINLVLATDAMCEEHNLVVVGNAKYITNYHPHCVLSTSLQEFSNLRTLNIDALKQQLR
jgi:hypothetical protein